MSETEMLADMIVGFKSLRETFTIAGSENAEVVDHRRLSGRADEAFAQCTGNLKMRLAEGRLSTSPSIFHFATGCSRHWPGNFLIRRCAK